LRAEGEHEYWTNAQIFTKKLDIPKIKDQCCLHLAGAAAAWRAAGQLRPRVVSGLPSAARFDERRDLAGIFVIDRVFVAADAIGIGVRGADRGQRLAQRLEIAGEL
jgi:hypothetical protein